MNHRGPRALGAIPAAILLVAAGSGCGSGSGGDDSDDWYYHWNCHGDPECLSLGPGADGQESGTLNEGPVYANCSALLTFADHNWNIPPATNSCDHSPTGAVVDGGVVNAKRVFATNVIYNGALGGLSGADAKCSLAASAAGLAGTFKAWMSDGTTNAIDRIADVGPWARMDGMIAFNNKANLMTGPIVGINFNENGVLITTAGAVWTGTLVGGTASTSRCADWTDTASTATTGYVNSADGQWTAGIDSHDTSCAAQFRIYCFQQ